MRINRASPDLNSKVCSLNKIKAVCAGLKKKKKKIVFTNGCFDILHYGHVRYLEDAKKFGDSLIVGINSDSSVKKIKGPKRPVVGENDRIRIVAALASVDYAILFKEKAPLNIIETIKPDVLVKGSDWKKSQIAGADFVLACGGSVKTVKLEAGRSTSGILTKIAKSIRV